uniref:Uncharacterized protein n=1 Tax=Sciurus vulgaris TaxID=55149 RepID=A0A8D2APF2_SCIVU
MAAEGGGKEMNEIKIQCTTWEGLHKLLPHSEYSRPARCPSARRDATLSGLPSSTSTITLKDQSGNGDRSCFTITAADLSKPVDNGYTKEHMSLSSWAFPQSPQLFNEERLVAKACVTSPGNSVSPLLPWSNSLPHSPVVFKPSAKAAFWMEPLPLGTANLQLLCCTTTRRGTRRKTTNGNLTFLARAVTN